MDALDSIKQAREHIVRSNRIENLSTRARRKFTQLLKSNIPLVATMKYALHKIFDFSVRRLARASRAYQIMEMPNAQSTQLTLAIRITGGIGDNLVIARWLRAASQRIGNNIAIDIFYISPRSVEFIFGAIDNVRHVIDDVIFESVRKSYDAAAIANQFLVFYCADIHFERVVRYSPILLQLIATTERNRKAFEKYIQFHPSLDGAFADHATKLGLTRDQFIFYQTGVNFETFAMPLLLPDVELDSCFALQPNHYITIHDGWDAGFRLVSKRPTKAYPVVQWNKLVELLKKHLPNMKIVQLGGPTGSVIEGTDLNLKGKITLPQAARVLQGAALHIDTESGLVHIASAIGTRSVVLFGPTNVDFFGYSQNINIAAENCRNCWWSTDAWMDACPRGDEQPRCMLSLTPERIAKVVAGAILN